MRERCGAPAVRDNLEVVLKARLHLLELGGVRSRRQVDDRAEKQLDLGVRHPLPVEDLRPWGERRSGVGSHGANDTMRPSGEASRARTNEVPAASVVGGDVRLPYGRPVRELTTFLSKSSRPPDPAGIRVAGRVHFVHAPRGAPPALAHNPDPGFC